MTRRQANETAEDSPRSRALEVLHALEVLEARWRPRSRAPQDLVGPAVHWPFAALYLESTRGQIDLGQRLCWPDFHYGVIDHFFHLYSRSVLARLDTAVPATAVRHTPGWDRYFSVLEAGASRPPSFRCAAVLGAQAHIDDDLGPAIMAAFRDAASSDAMGDVATLTDRAQQTLFSPFAGALHQTVRRAYLRRLAALPAGFSANVARVQPHHMAYWLPATILLPSRFQGIRRRAWLRARRALEAASGERGPVVEQGVDSLRPAPSGR